jgi:hypothetical protein
MNIREVENIFLIAGGPSAKGLDFQRLVGKGFILGVKEAFFHTPSDACFTMDRRWNHHRLPQLQKRQAKVFASQKHWGSKWGGRHIEPWDGVEWFKVWVDREGLSDMPGVLNAKNSGFAALNLAYQCNPKRIFLFGYDLSMPTGGEEYWYRPPDWRKPRRNYDSEARRWMRDHELAAPYFKIKGIQVYNVSKQSAIPYYQKLSWEKMLKLLEVA